MAICGREVVVLALGAAALAGVLLASQGPTSTPAAPRKARFADPSRVARLTAQIQKLRPLARLLDKPKPGDWLYEHKEPGQTFRQYLAAKPTVPAETRSRIYVQPLGRFNAKQRQVVKLAAEFLGIYYGLDVTVADDLPLSLIPTGARRIHPQLRDMQINTGYVLEKVLLPRVPADAFCVIALTTSDLWPGEGWNFVFGSASLRRRVGVWSLYRYGDLEAGESQYRLVLLRTLKTAAHEVGHMFSIPHCTAYQCGMCGSNSLAEADRRPIFLGPECLAKVCYAGGIEPASRYKKLAAFFRANGLAAQANYCAKSLTALGLRAATKPAATRPAL